MAAGRLVAAGSFILLLRCSHGPASAFVLSPLAAVDSHAGQHTGSFPQPLCARAPDGIGSDNEAEDAARLYQTLAAEEGRRRKEERNGANGSSTNISGKGFGAGASGGKRGGRATRRHPTSNDTTPASQPGRKSQHAEDVEQGRKMRVRLKALDKELEDNMGAPPRGETENRKRKSMEAEVNRLKLQLAEAKREAEEKERRAEGAELRVRKLLDGSSSPAPGPIPTSSARGGADAVESLRAAHAAQVETLRAENRRRLGNYERAAAMDRRTLRNRAWSLETELTKQKTVLEMARREADEAKARAEELEAEMIDVVGRGDARIAELEKEVEVAAQSLVRTRKRAATRLVAMREVLRSRLRRADDEVEERLNNVREEMNGKLRRVQRVANEDLLVLRRQSADSVARAKLEKERTVSSEREQLEAYKILMAGRLEREKEIVERRVKAAKEEMARRLEDAHTSMEEEKRSLREEGRNKVAEVQAKAALETRRLLDEMDRKLGMKATRRVGLEEELAGSEAAIQEYKEERTSLRRLASLAGGLMTRKLRLKRKEFEDNEQEEL